MMSLEVTKDRKALLGWFSRNRREFPWRGNVSSYGVWVSEVMLQQTRASVVIAYYQKWMETFPTLEVLAKSDKEQVLKIWEGLGYYSRARNLHEGAKFILDHFDGVIPKDPEKLKQIKGLGPYTIGAIRSFAFQEKAVAIDGNVTRVISRYFAIKEEISKGKTKQEIKGKTEVFLNGKTPHVVMEGLIELGATVCKPLPYCAECPLNQNCLSNKYSLTEEIPNKAKPQKIVIKQRLVFVFYHENRYAIFRQKNSLMKDLYQFPYLDFTSKMTGERVKQLAKQSLDASLHRIVPLQKMLQFYTKYKVKLYPYLVEIKDQSLSKNYQWVNLSELKSLPFCSGHRKILHQL